MGDSSNSSRADVGMGNDSSSEKKATQTANPVAVKAAKPVFKGQPFAARLIWAETRVAQNIEGRPLETVAEFQERTAVVLGFTAEQSGKLQLRFNGEILRSSMTLGDAQIGEESEIQVEGGEILKAEVALTINLHAAAEQGDIKQLAQMIKYAPQRIDEHSAADDRNYVNQSTPLHVAASNGRLAAVQTLLQAKAELNARDKDGCTPLQYAQDYGASSVAAHLIEAGADK